MTRYLGLLLLATLGQAQTDWPSYGNDPGAMRYSTARQINALNVGKLALGWTFRTGKPGSEDIPIVVGGVMYVTAPDGVYALVPETGQLLWKFDASPVALRGLAYWPGGRGLNARVFAGNGPFLLALDVNTGKPAPAFGNEGRLDRSDFPRHDRLRHAAETRKTGLGLGELSGHALDARNLNAGPRREPKRLHSVAGRKQAGGGRPIREKPASDVIGAQTEHRVERVCVSR